MFPGVKFGHQNFRPVLEATKARYAEVWFRLDWREKYQELFNYLNAHKINFGLHFWDMVGGKYFPSLLVEDQVVVKETYLKICETLKIASRIGASYVNFHPESYRLNLLDLDKLTIKTLNPNQTIDKEKSFHQLVFYLEKIRLLGQKLGVIPYLETVPRYAPTNFSEENEDRIHLQKSEGLETEKFIKLAEAGFPICLDIGHTLSQKESQDNQVLFNYLFASAKKMLPAIGLMHITTNTPPHNGTDSHNGILAADFAAGAVPNKKQLIKLLSLFKNKDVWLIPEPRIKNMAANYFRLLRLF